MKSWLLPFFLIFFATIMNLQAAETVKIGAVILKFDKGKSVYVKTIRP